MYIYCEHFYVELVKIQTDFFKSFLKVAKLTSESMQKDDLFILIVQIRKTKSLG